MPRKSETNSYTASVQETLQGIIDGKFELISAITTGNTIKLGINKGEKNEAGEVIPFEFSFSPRTAAGKIVIGETKYSKEECIAALAGYVAETANQSSSRYNLYAKSPEGKEKKIPNTQAIMLTLGCWPAMAITKLLFKRDANGEPELNSKTPDEVIAMQEEINAKMKAEKPVAKEKKEKTAETPATK